MFCTVLSITYTKAALQRTVSQNPREQATWDIDTSRKMVREKEEELLGENNGSSPAT